MLLTRDELVKACRCPRPGQPWKASRDVSYFGSQSIPRRGAGMKARRLLVASGIVQSHQIQVSVPVLADKKIIGVLVVGINLAKFTQGQR
jgi:hypothetical protein